MCVNDIQVCEQVIRIQVIGIWRVSCVQGTFVFESASWNVVCKVSCVQGLYVCVLECKLEADVTPFIFSSDEYIDVSWYDGVCKIGQL